MGNLWLLGGVAVVAWLLSSRESPGEASIAAARAVHRLLPDHQGAAEWAPIVAYQAASDGVPWPVAVAVAWQESSFDPSAVSDLGAVGLMQVTPIALAEVQRHGFYKSLTFDALKDGNLSAAVGVRLLRILYERFGPSWQESVSHYFWGEHVKTPVYGEQVTAKADQLREAASA